MLTREEIMAHAVPNQDTVAVTTTQGLLVPFDASRVAIIIDNIGADAVLISWKKGTGATEGIRLSKKDTAGPNCIILDVWDVGRAIRGPIFVVAEATSSVVTIVESRWGGGEL